ncbi:MAG: GxxExxY protein [Anaerolineae bacterium]|nr:MAG: GxxExxY protein [Anaerolineae bacterium]
MNAIGTGRGNVRKADLLYPDLSYQIMQVMFEVHNQLGPGFPEGIYERAAVLEFKARRIPIEEQKTIQVMYKGQVVGTYRIDLIVDGKIILELKAVSALNDLFKQQVLAYLKATGLRLGILVNFGASRVEAVRIVN